MVIFDLDGVLINSKNNMRKSWNKVREIHKIRNKFEEYFKYIGLPFLEILKRLRIMDKHSKIFKTFKKVSVKRHFFQSASASFSFSKHVCAWLLNIKEMGRWSLKIFFSSYFVIIFIYASSRWLGKPDRLEDKYFGRNNKS